MIKFLHILQSSTEKKASLIPKHPLNHGFLGGNLSQYILGGPHPERGGDVHVFTSQWKLIPGFFLLRNSWMIPVPVSLHGGPGFF